MRALLSPLLFATIAASANADDCYGNLGWVNGAPEHVAIGQTIDVCLKGPVDALGLFMMSTGESSVPSRYGTICLEFPLLGAFVFTFDANGDYCFPIEVDCDPALIGAQVYSQFFTCHPNKGISNQVLTTVDAGICDGDYATFTPGGWGTTCSGNNPGCLRDQWFDTVFPNGLIIGDTDGIDGDSEFAILLTSSAAVESFIPTGGKASPLDADATDPATSAAGVFAGQLIAAKLSLGFDDAGALDAYKNNPSVKLGDLVFVGGVDSDLLGWTVRDLIDLADQAISGALGTDIDITGDGNADVKITDISTALDVLNNNFDNGTQNNGNLAIS
jgi:hypothetical protein